jgi:hypothetical protein
MTVDAGITKPSNSIVIAGEPYVQYRKVETASEMYPGRLVIKGTNQDDIVVCGAGGIATGWLGYEQTTKKHRPATVDTIYLQNAQAAVLSGPSFQLVAGLAQSQTIVKGDRLVAAANGFLSKASAAAVGSGTVAVLGTGAQPTMTGPIPTEGIVVAVAEENVTTTGAEADIMVRSLI